MTFTKAIKAKSWLRLAIDGVSGSGKTYSALAIARGMAEAMGGAKIALIDTEHGSASLYADRFEFDTLNLTRFQIEDYCEAIEAAAQAAYEILIIDSTSHGWEALVERVDRIAAQKYKDNSFRAWGEGTPLQRRLIEKLLSYPGHVIVTCRSKTEYGMETYEENGRKKTAVKKLGMAPVQRQGFEYEFTLTMSMNHENTGVITKDRTGKFQGQFMDKPGAEFGKALVEWLSQGADIPLEKPADETPGGSAGLQEKRQAVIAEIGGVLNAKDGEGACLFTQTEKEIERQFIKETPLTQEGLWKLIERKTRLAEVYAEREKERYSA